MAVIWIFAWCGVAGFQWWQRKKNEDGYWDYWKKWMIISIIVLIVIVIIWAMIPSVICKVPDTTNIPYYGR